jgi:hypothetical protein
MARYVCMVSCVVSPEAPLLMGAGYRPVLCAEGSVLEDLGESKVCVDYSWDEEGRVEERYEMRKVRIVGSAVIGWVSWSPSYFEEEPPDYDDSANDWKGAA